MNQLEKVPLGSSEIMITRLISGGNPLCGNSHFSKTMDQQMREYFTAEKVVEYLHRLQAAGINTLQARGDYHRILYWLELFKPQDAVVIGMFPHQTDQIKDNLQYTIAALSHGSHEGNNIEVMKKIRL